MRAIPQHRAVRDVLIGGTWLTLIPETVDVKGGSSEGEGGTLTGLLDHRPGHQDRRAGHRLRCEVKFVQAVLYISGEEEKIREGRWAGGGAVE